MTLNKHDERMVRIAIMIADVVDRENLSLIEYLTVLEIARASALRIVIQKDETKVLA